MHFFSFLRHGSHFRAKTVRRNNNQQKNKEGGGRERKNKQIFPRFAPNLDYFLVELASGMQLRVSLFKSRTWVQ